MPNPNVDDVRFYDNGTIAFWVNKQVGEWFHITTVHNPDECSVYIDKECIIKQSRTKPKKGFNMLRWIKNLRKASAEVELDSLKENCELLTAENSELKKQKMKTLEELEEIKLKKRLEAEEIKHMSRINEERLKAEVEAEKLEVKKNYQDNINAFKEEQRQQLVDSLKQFHTKMEQRFNSELNSFKEMHKVIIDRLPNINYEISRHVGDAKYIEAPGKNRKR